MPTQEQVTSEVRILKNLKPVIQRHGIFDDDNWMAIDAEIAVLERNLSREDIVKVWEDRETQDAALYAREWIDGHGDAPPSFSWAPLARISLQQPSVC